MSRPIFSSSSETRSPSTQVEDTQDHERRDQRIAESDAYRERLRAELAGIAVDETVGAGGVDRDSREEAGGDRAPGAADAVHADYVQRVVEVQAVAHLDGQVTEYTSADADGDEPAQRRRSRTRA